MFTMMVSANCKDTFILSSQNFKTERNFIRSALTQLEMYIWTCKVIAHEITKQILQDKILTLRTKVRNSIRRTQYIISAISFACVKSFDFLNYRPFVDFFLPVCVLYRKNENSTILLKYSTHKRLYFAKTTVRELFVQNLDSCK